MKNRLRRAVIIFPAFVIGMILYIAFHELGHLIVAVSAGATITEYSIIHAHTSWVGGTFTINKYLWVNVNGALLPILLSYIYALTYSEKIKNEFYKAISFVVSVAPLFSLIAWVIIPILNTFGMMSNGLADDDVTKFVFYFSVGHSPIWVSIGAAAMIALGVFIVVKKGIIRGWITYIRKSE